MNVAMRAALDREFPGASERVKLAIRQFLFSQPLAVKCANGMFISHSLPADRYADKFDHRIFDRQLRINDIVKPGSAYLLTWGRNLSQELLDRHFCPWPPEARAGLLQGREQSDYPCVGP
jgi:hypothetical protein